MYTQIYILLKLLQITVELHKFYIFSCSISYVT
jgi:hypothetical protein